MNGLGADGGCLGAGPRVAQGGLGAADCRTNHAEHRAKKYWPTNTTRLSHVSRETSARREGLFHVKHPTDRL